MYLADYHIHSTCSPDGKLTMAAMAEAAVQKGLQEICFTDHVDTIYWRDRRPRHDFDWDGMQKQYREAVEQWGDRIVIRMGCELGESAMSFDRAEHLLSTAPELDFIIGSVHMAGKAYDHMDLYFTPEGDSRYYHNVIDSYLEDVLAVAQWGRFHVLGHLTLPLRYINENYHAGIDFSGHSEQVREIFRCLIDKGLGIECNTNRGNAPLPDRDLLTLYRQMGGEIITLGSDAHSAKYVGCTIPERQELLRQCGFRYFTTFHNGQAEFRPL